MAATATPGRSSVRGDGGDEIAIMTAAILVSLALLAGYLIHALAT